MVRIQQVWVRRAACALMVAAGLLVPRVAAAQVVVDARIVDFVPSADHGAVSVDGEPIVQSYMMLIYRAGTTTLVATVDLGKPAKGGDGRIALDFVARLASPLATGVDYEARVAAIGPGGTTKSTLSNVFSYSAACAPTVSATSASVGSSASSGSVNVSAGSGCAWTATSAVGWITIAAGASGTGSGTVSFNVAANSSTTYRTGILTIAGHAYTVTQAGTVDCTYAITPLSKSAAAAGDSGVISVTAGASCAWTASSTASWLTVTSGSSGTGFGSVNYSVAANTGASRTASLLVAGKIFTVAQSGGGPCTYSISPSAKAVGRSGESFNVTVTTDAACSWSAASTNLWMRVTAGSLGKGNGTVGVTVGANLIPSERTGTMIIAGQTFTVIQEEATCTYSVTPGAPTFGSAGGTIPLWVGTYDACSWTASASAAWVSIPTTTRLGWGIVNLTVSPNTSGSARTTTIVVAGKSVTVTQSGTTSGPTTPRNFRIVSGGS